MERIEPIGPHTPALAPPDAYNVKVHASPGVGREGAQQSGQDARRKRASSERRRDAEGDPPQDEQGARSTENEDVGRRRRVDLEA